MENLICKTSKRTFDFETFYEELKKFKRKYHNINVPATYITKEGYKLGEKVIGVRAEHIKLYDIQKHKLDKISFIWDLRAYKFDIFYNELIKFKEKYHHLNVPKDYVTEDGYNLGEKVIAVRLGRTLIYETQRQKLYDIGFIWEVERESKLTNMDFNKVYAQLVKYKSQFNNLYVPYDYVVDNIELGFYVRNIRNHNISLSKDEKLSLISIGFEFDTHNTLYPNIEYSINDDDSLLVANMLNGDMCARDTLIVKYFNYAKNIVLKYSFTIGKDNLHDIAYEALMSCIDNAKEPATLKSYICKTIKGKVLNYLRNCKRFVSLYSAKSSDNDLKQIDKIKDKDITPETIHNNLFQTQLFEKLKSILTKREYRIICLYSGFNKKHTQFSIPAIAKTFHTNQEFIEKEIAKILKFLNDKLDKTEWNV